MSKTITVEKPSDFLRRMLSVENISNLRLNWTAKSEQTEVTISFVQSPAQGMAFLASSENAELELQCAYGVTTSLQVVGDCRRAYIVHFDVTYRVNDKATQAKLVESFKVWGSI